MEFDQPGQPVFAAADWQRPEIRVSGDGARDRGAACELISPDPATGAGVAFVRVESDPDPVRVRAEWVTDWDIRALAGQCIPDRVEWPEVAA